MNRPEEIWGDWSGTDEDQDLDPIIDPNAWGHVEDMTHESLADHLEQRAKMLDQRRPGAKMLREAAGRVRRSARIGEAVLHALEERPLATWFDVGAVLATDDDVREAIRDARGGPNVDAE